MTPELPLTAGGVPLPWIHQAKDRSHTRCLALHWCWVCGRPLGAHLCFVTDTAAVFSNSAYHAPMHRDCAELMQSMQPEKEGLTALWTVKKTQGGLKTPRRFNDGITNTFHCLMGPPVVPPVWQHPDRRPATRMEVVDALEEHFRAAVTTAVDKEEIVDLDFTLTRALAQFLPAA
jgi:hypothetical protein